MAFEKFTDFEGISIEEIDNEWWFDLSDQREVKLRTGERQWFKEKLTIPCQVPICCEDIRVVRDIHKFSDLSMVQDIQPKSFAPLESLRDELGKALTEKTAQDDPETLDDSDLELLAGDDYFVEDTHIEKKGQVKSAATVRTRLIASRGTLKSDFKEQVFPCPFDIIDCKIRYSSLEKTDDVAIILSSEGLIYSVAFDAKLNPVVLQWWELKKIDGVPCGICMLSSSSQFVITTDTTLKFYKFIDAYHFELVSNWHLMDTAISATAFLSSGDRKDHFMLFTALKRRKEVILCLTQWGSPDQERKEVHTLTLLDGEPISNIVSLDDSRCLAFTNTDIKLVSANQILSGELTFESFKRSMFGSRVTKCFDDPILLSRIRSFKEDLQDAVHCSVIATSNGALCCCLSEEDGPVTFLALTRVKGLDNAFLLDNSSTSDDCYTVTISAYGQLTDICLDLRNIDELDKDFKISSSQNIRSSKIISAGHQPAQSIAYVPRLQTQLDQQDRPCLLSQSTLSLISPKEPVQTCSVLYSTRSFKAVSTLNVIDCLDLPEKWQRQLFGDVSKGGFQHLILNETRTGKSSLLLIEWTADYSTHKLTELDDLLRDDLNCTIAVHFTDHNIVQVTSHVLSVDGFESNDWHSYQFNFSANGAVCDRERLIVWNSDSGNMLFIKDVNDTRFEMYHELKIPFKDSHSKITAVMFANDEHGLESIRVVSGETVYQVYWDDLDSLENAFKEVNEVQVHYGSTYGAESVLSDLNGGVYRWRTDDCMPAKLRLDKLNVESEFGFPWEIRFVSKSECVLFSPRRMYLLKLTDMSFVEISLGFHKKHATMIDARISGKLLFVLFSDGLEVLFRSSLTYTRLHLPVKNARIKHKKFLHLDRINRMLIVNWSRKTLESLKLENGRLMLLDSQCLEAFSTIIETIELKSNAGPINVLIAGSTDSGHWLLKLLQVVPLPGKLITRDASTHRFEGPIPENVQLVPVSESSFWISFDTHLQLFSLDHDTLSPMGVVEHSEEKFESLDARPDILVALKRNGDFKVKTRQNDGTWLSADILRNPSSSLKYHKTLVISRDLVVMVGECHDILAACAVMTFFTPLRDEVVYFNDIWFAERIKDVKYSHKNEELCVLLESGNVTFLGSQREYHKVSHVIGQRVRIGPAQGKIGQTGCWDIMPHQLVLSQT
ncbi:Mms1p LALA0_S10e01574g [Lachancea lanzarotensis]|uniref:LALA0S10e01574g1_1 n=1 Tax=Lachancea lanzarotensis TaxID=1245769 RepID=A0A0C7N1S1_9SACH|nr:uncharacterized protein LALA0_S10e01574g [Lachancea lanzarotensis]CEP64069.1 LALA0S10e01574g1_1 [Lachancea lanzarotensis]